MKTLLLLMALSVSCTRAKTPMECGIEKAAYNKCFDNLGDARRTDHKKFFTELCEWKKEVYPCKLDQYELDSYVDYRCPPVKGCNGN